MVRRHIFTVSDYGCGALRRLRLALREIGLTSSLLFANFLFEGRDLCCGLSPNAVGSRSARAAWCAGSDPAKCRRRVDGDKRIDPCFDLF